MKGLPYLLSPGMVAFLVLVLIQVTIGVLYKLAGASGTYKFSAASSLAISEFVKFMLSYGLFIATHKPTPPKSSLDKQRHDEWSPPFLGTGLVGRWRQCNMILMRNAWSAFVPIAGLSSLYAINNHFAFWLYLAIDPGTISLVKSASTFISAYMLWTIFGRVTNRIQWLAIALQAMGIIASQYDPCKGGTVYPVGSPNTQGHGFFDGYDTIAIIVVFCNCIIGLVITAVYKYADAVIKTMAQTISTGILLIISAIIFQASFGILQASGVVIIFLSVYIYFVCSTNPLNDSIKQYFGSVTQMNESYVKMRLIIGGMIGILSFLGLTEIYWTDKSARSFSMANNTAKNQLPKTHASIDGKENVQLLEVASDATASNSIYNTSVTNFYKDILVAVNWNRARYNPNLWHWREIYPRELFPNVVHYGPDDPILNELTSDDDEVRIDDRVNQGYPGSFGYHSLLRALEDFQGKNYTGVFWVNFDVLINVAALTRADKESVWYTPKIAFMPFSAEGTENVKKISKGWEVWFPGGFHDSKTVYDNLPADEVARFLKKVSPSGERVVPFPFTYYWEVPFVVDADGVSGAGFSSDAIYVPFKHAKRAAEFLRVANDANLFLEFTVPFLSEWLKVEAKLTPWNDTSGLGEVTCDSVKQGDKIGQVLDIYHGIHLYTESKARQWSKYVEKYYKNEKTKEEIRPGS
ncbi:hypothetical protein HDU97_008305 [Phlyctochytrium planicorne]|nr:hypothetical protein HDU97_008305 [Phlyctochytrium planicorne]